MRSAHFAATDRPVCRSCSPRASGRLRPLRPGPPAGGPLARGAGLRPVLHRRAAPPGPVRILRPAAAAGHPARPGRRHLRGLRRDPGHPRLRATAGPRTSSTRRAAAPGAACAAAPARCCPAGTGTASRRADRRVRGDQRRPPAAQRAELAAQGRRRRPARRRGRRPAGRHPRGARRLPSRAGPPTTCGTCSPPAASLPARDEELARTGQWLGRLLDAISPPADRRLVQAYATWQVMRRLRASAAAAARPRTPTAHARNTSAPPPACSPGSATAAPRWPPAGRPTSTNGSPPGRQPARARDFLAWAAARGHCQPLTIPAPARGQPAPRSARTSGGRWPPGCCTTTALDPTDRVAGCLLLLYGQPLSRIAAMTTSQVTRRDGETFVRSAGTTCPSPSPLAAPLLQLISRRPQPTRGVGSPPPPLAVPRAACPAARSPRPRLGERLRALGIYAQTAAVPRCSTSPPSCPPRSSPTSSACTRPPPPDGCTKPEATGPAMPPS